MTFAHLPAGYITCRLLYNQFKHRIDSWNCYLLWGLLGSVAPDFDHLYFWFINREQDQHLNFSHYPLFWVLLLIFSAFWFVIDRKSQNPVSAFMVSFGGFIHMILDTVPGHIFWLAPFSYQPFSIGELVEAANPWLVQSFPGWAYGVELLILIWSFSLFSRNSLRACPQSEAIE